MKECIRRVRLQMDYAVLSFMREKEGVEERREKFTKSLKVNEKTKRGESK